MPEIEILVVS